MFSPSFLPSCSHYPPLLSPLHPHMSAAKPPPLASRSRLFLCLCGIGLIPMRPDASTCDRTPIHMRRLVYACSVARWRLVIHCTMMMNLKSLLPNRRSFFSFGRTLLGSFKCALSLVGRWVYVYTTEEYEYIYMHVTYMYVCTNNGVYIYIHT